MMKYLAVLMFTFLFSPTIYADEIEEKIKTGMSKSEVINIFNSAPDTDECSNIAGLSKCSLVWKRGILTKSVYTITFVMDKVILVTRNNTKLLGN